MNVEEKNPFAFWKPNARGSASSLLLYLLIFIKGKVIPLSRKQVVQGRRR